MKCSKCGAELVEGAKFCRECGARVVHEENFPVMSAKTPNDVKMPSMGKSIGTDVERLGLKSAPYLPKNDSLSGLLRSGLPSASAQRTDEHLDDKPVLTSTSAVIEEYDGETDAIDGIGATTTPAQKMQKKSSLKRRTFIICGIVGGCLGAHFIYAKRWGLLALLWGGLILGGSLLPDDVAEGNTGNVPSSTAQPMAADKACEVAGNVFVGLWALMWIGGTIFIKKDGKGNEFG